MESQTTALLEHLESLQLELVISKDDNRKQELQTEIESVKKEIKSYE